MFWLAAASLGLWICVVRKLPSDADNAPPKTNFSEALKDVPLWKNKQSWTLPGWYPLVYV